MKVKDMNIIKATKKDLPDIFLLLKEVNLPTDGVTEHFKNFLVLKIDRKLIGCVGLEITKTSCLIRSLAVTTVEQGKGYGQLLVKAVLHLITNKGIRKAYLLTTDGEDYFKKFGFRVIDRKEAEPDIQKTPQFTYICCQSAVCMVKTIE